MSQHSYSIMSHLLEKILLAIGGVGHLPPGGQWQLIGDIERLMSYVYVVRGTWTGSRTGPGPWADQARGWGVRAHVLRRQPGRPAARVRAGLARVRARVGLSEEGLRQVLLSPGARLRVHDRVKKRLQVRVRVFGHMDDLLARQRLKWVVAHFILLEKKQLSEGQSTGGGLASKHPDEAVKKQARTS